MSIQTVDGNQILADDNPSHIVVNYNMAISALRTHIVAEHSHADTIPEIVMETTGNRPSALPTKAALANGCYFCNIRLPWFQPTEIWTCIVLGPRCQWFCIVGEAVKPWECVGDVLCQ